MSLIDTTQLTLEAAMRGSMQRQTLLTNNLANADTAGYKAEDVDFQGALRTALAQGQSPSNVQFSDYTENTSDTADGNGVSSEQDSADIAENGLLYQDLTEVASARNQILQTAMGTSS
jgi:flagellar basal-body rod protein FlgB